jgi:hypothetical protein
LFGSGIDPFNIIELLLNINADTAREVPRILSGVLPADLPRLFGL